MKRHENLVQLFEASCKEHRPRPLFGTKHGDAWRWLTYGQVAERVAAMRGGLHAIGVGRGDRVAIVSDNRVEWAVVAFASSSLGAAVVPMYEVQHPSEWQFIIEDSGAKVVFAGTRAIGDTLRRTQPELPALERVIDIEGDDDDSFADLLVRGAASPRASQQPEPDDIASLVYTSGTTGRPKGVLLSHDNITSNVAAIQPLFPFTPDDRSLSFLPWAHVFGQTCELFGLISLGCSTAINDALDNLVANLAEVKPTILVAVPRIFNRIYERIQGQVAARPAPVRKLFAAGVAAGAKRGRGEPLSGVERAARALADALMFRKVRAKFGGRLRYAVSGSAALEVEVAELIDALGITVYEGYGLTETSPIVTVNSPGSRKIGSVGKVIEGVSVTLDETVSERPGEGEVIVRGPNVMKGYYHRPEETAAALLPDGGFRTGDLGRFDRDGFLFITGRIKEQYKLETGKYVMPTAVEEHIKLSPLISNVLVYGANRPYNVALVVPDRQAIERWAAERHLTIDAVDRSPEVEAMLMAEIDDRCAALKSFERPRRVAVLLDDFTTANGLATPTLKLRRNRIIERYADRIERLYQPERAPAPREGAEARP